MSVLGNIDSNTFLKNKLNRCLHSALFQVPGDSRTSLKGAKEKAEFTELLAALRDLCNYWVLFTKCCLIYPHHL